MTEEKLNTQSTDDRNLPNVTIVIPAYNEEKYIGRCLDSAMAQDYPDGKIEVIVVDNGSTDNTATIARDKGAIVIVEPTAKVGGVRNMGAAAATGEVLAFLDSDCVAPVAWVSTAVEELTTGTSLGAVGGNYLVEANASWIEKSWTLRPIQAKQNVKYLAAGNLVMKKSLFDDLHGFDELLHAGEDEEFCARLRSLGCQLIKTPECSVIHLGYPKTMSEIISREMWHGSSQLEAASSFFDRTIVAIHLFVVAAMTILIAPVVPALYPGPFVVAVLVMIGLPALGSLRRSTLSKGRWGLVSRRFQLWVLYVVYFTGRTAGLAINYKRVITNRDVRIRRSK